jgi:hypothetical protein
LFQLHSLYICATISDMKKNILLFGCLVVIASCGRYSKVVDLPKKDQMLENPRIYGDVDGPPKQSKNTYPTPADAADQSARIKDILFNRKKPVTAPVAQEVSVPAPAETAPADTAATK